MKLLTNCGSADHLAELRRCFLHADEITVLVAYLSKHGLDSLAPSLAKASKRAKSIEFFCGLDGCITDPEALRSLSRLLKSKPGTKHKLFLVETAASTFHPKVYQFKSSGSLRVVIGSANLTGGGLEQNWEASLVLEGKEGDAILNELSSYRTEVLQIAKEVTGNWD